MMYGQRMPRVWPPVTVHLFLWQRLEAEKQKRRHAPKPAVAEARANIDQDARSEANAETQIIAEHADVLQRKLDEQDAAACKAIEEVQQRCDQLQHELHEAV